MKKAAVAKQLRKLAAIGWVRREDDGSLTLAAWGVPGVFELEAHDAGGTWAAPTLTLQGQGVAPQDPGAPQDPTPGGSPPITPQDPTLTLQAPGVPLEGHQSCVSSSSSNTNLGDARDATPAPQGIPAQLAEQRRRARAKSREYMAATTLPPELNRRLRNHANGAWSVELRGAKWVESLIETMSSMGLDADTVCKLLDEHQRAQDAGEPVPERITMWYARYPHQASRAWLTTALDRMRAPVRRRGTDDGYKDELARIYA
jgi:hypothetical protein